jgi:type VII secretion protein EccE
VAVPRRRPGYLGAVGIVRVVVAEAVLVLVLVTLVDSSWMLVTALEASLLLVVALFVRRGGRWLSDFVALRRDLRRRASAARSGGAGPGGGTPSALGALLPDLASENTVGSDGVPVGVAGDGAGWFATIMVTPPRTPPGDGHPPAVPLDAMTKAMADADLPGWVLQVVTHSRPAPGADLDTPPPCTQSYRELARSVGASAAPAQDIWVVARIDARRLAETGRSAAEASRDAPGMLAALVRRLCRVIRQAGLTSQVLDADGVVEALSRSLDPGPGSEPAPAPVTSGSRRQPREEWAAWYSPRLAHVSFWLRGWPAPEHFGAFASQLTSTAAVLTSVALVSEPGRRGLDVRCLVRVAARPAAVSKACAELRSVADGMGARLFRLDGEQGPAAYASAPSGGGTG